MQASPSPVDVVLLHANFDDGCVRLRVSDHGGGFLLPAVRPVPPELLQGRGLLLARALSDELDVSRSRGVTTVTVHKRLSHRIR